MNLDITHDDKPITKDVFGRFQNGIELIVKDGNPFVVFKGRWVMADPMFEFTLHGLDIDLRGNAQFISSPDEDIFFMQLSRTFQYQIVAVLGEHDAWYVKPSRHYPQRLNILGDDYTIEWCMSLKGSDTSTVLPYNPVRIDRVTFQRSIPKNAELNLPTTLT